MAVAVAMLTLTGCVLQPELRIYSQPEGAYISGLSSGQTYGMAPAVIRFDKEELARHTNADGCYIFDGIEARWGSGATTTLQNIRMCGEGWQHPDVIMTRPAGYPRLDQDLQIELQLRETRALEQQAAAAAQQAQAARQAAEAAQRQLYNQQREQRERHEREQREEQRDKEARAKAAHDNAQHEDKKDKPQEQHQEQPKAKTGPAATVGTPAEPPHQDAPQQ